MKCIRVVHVLHHSPWYFRDLALPMDGNSMADDWHVRTALALDHLCSGRWDLECWRPDWREPRETCLTVRGLRCRVFPSRPAPLGRFFLELSRPMLRALHKEAKRGRFILHMHELHSATGLLAAWLPGRVIKVAHTHGSPPVGLRLAPGRPAWVRVLSRFLLPLEDASIARYRHVFAIADRELEYLRSLNHPASKVTMGVDFTTFVPQEKNEARLKLGLPRDAKVVLYVGRFHRVGGVDRLLSAMQEVKLRVPGALLLAVGGSPQDELYGDLMAKADKALPRIPHKEMPAVLGASDLLVFLAGDTGFSGIGVATVEALAMNLAVASGSLMEFPGAEKERAKLGLIPDPPNETLSETIIRGLSLAGSLSPRETARPVYDWPVIAARIAEVYEELLAS